MLQTRRVHHLAAGEGPCICYSGQELHVKLAAAQSDGEMTVIESRIPAGGGPPLHIHECENETYIRRAKGTEPTDHDRDRRPVRYFVRVIAT